MVNSYELSLMGWALAATVALDKGLAEPSEKHVVFLRN